MGDIRNPWINWYRPFIICILQKSLLILCKIGIHKRKFIDRLEWPYGEYEDITKCIRCNNLKIKNR